MGIDDNGAPASKQQSRLAVMFGVVLGGVFFFVLLNSMRENYEWNRWAADHCKSVSAISDDPVNVVATNPEAYQQGKTGWQCDDGKTYWR